MFRENYSKLVPVLLFWYVVCVVQYVSEGPRKNGRVKENIDDGICKKVNERKTKIGRSLL